MMLDFSKLRTTTDEDRAAAEARRHAALRRDDDAAFAGKRLHRIEVQVHGDIRCNYNGQRIIQAAFPKGRAGMVFTGYRGDLVNETLVRELRNRAEAISDADAPVMTATVEGFWRKRPWTNSAGLLVEAWDFIVASWEYQPREAETSVVHGALAA